MSCGRCGNNEVGGTQDYPCRGRLNKVREELDRLEKCLIAAATPPTPRPPRPGQCRCRCCCCCCCHWQDNTNNNNTTWGR